jgi:hypothetical protein
MKFFTFRQNNSGGFFLGPAQYVIIQAVDADQADNLALDVGLYFNGVVGNQDCDCCGDRWTCQYGDDDGSDTPMIYGTPAADYVRGHRADGQPKAVVYYKDGTTTTYP